MTIFKDTLYFHNLSMSCHLLQDTFMLAHSVFKMNNQPHILQLICKSYILYLYNIIGCHCFTIAITFSYYVCFMSFFHKKGLYSSLCSIKINKYSRILWWICNTCVLHQHNIMGCHHWTIILIYLYLSILSFVARIIYVGSTSIQMNNQYVCLCQLTNFFLIKIKMHCW